MSFSRSLKKRFLIFSPPSPPSLFFSSKLSVQREVLGDPHIAKTRKGTNTPPLKILSTYHTVLQEMKKAMAAAAAPPGCGRKDTTVLGCGGERTHPRRRNGINTKGFSVFFGSCMMRWGDEGVVVKAPKCLAQRERERGRERGKRGTPTFNALAANFLRPPFGMRKTKNDTKRG